MSWVRRLISKLNLMISLDWIVFMIFFMTFYHDSSSWLSIKVKRSSCFSRHVSRHVSHHVSHHVFLYVSFYVFLHVFCHDSLSNNLHVSLLNDLHVSLYVSHHDSLSNDLHVFSSWLSIKKIMQKDNAKVGKISIFNSLDIKLKFLMSQVKLT